MQIRREALRRIAISERKGRNVLEENGQEVKEKLSALGPMAFFPYTTEIVRSYMEAMIPICRVANH
jgi:hypothetical protein